MRNSETYTYPDTVLLFSSAKANDSLCEVVHNRDINLFGVNGACICTDLISLENKVFEK